MIRIKAALVLLLVAAVVLRIVLWAIEPLVPLALAGIALMFVYGFIFKRRW